MAASREEIDLVVNALAKGFDALNADIKNTGESFGKMALQQQLAAEKSNLFDKQMRELATGVAKGTISFEDASKRADELAQKLGLVKEPAKQLSEEVKKQKLSWTDLKSAIDLGVQAYQKVAQVAQAAYEGLKEGAQLELARNQFDNLAESIGTTSESMLNDLRAATKGMQSDAQLIAGATDIISLGLSDTQEGTVRLATAVSTLGLDMQQVILTFANNSKARLDALGLSIEDVDAKTQELNEQGFDGDAFDEAVLIALEEKMALLGDASETTAGSLQILETSWKNLTDSWKQGAAEALAPTIKNLADNRQRIEILRDAYDRNILTYGEYNDAVSKINVQGQDMIEVMRELGVVMDENGNIIGSVVDGNVKLNEQMQKNAEAATSNAEALRAYHQAAAAAAGSNEELSDKQLQLASHTGTTEQAVLAANLANQQYFDELEAGAAALEETAAAELAAAEAAKAQAASMGDLFRQAIDTDGAIGLFNETAAQMAETTDAATINQDALNQAIFDAADSQGASAEQLAILGGALGLYSDEAVEAALQTALIQAKIDELTAQYVAGEISVQDMRVSLEEFIATINEVPGSVTTDVQVNGVDEAISKLGGLQAQLSALGGQVSAAEAAGAVQKPGGGIGLAGGADFTVPPGYPNDSFGPIWVQSGEHVQVTPPGQSGGGRGGVVQNNYFSNPANPNAIATATAEKLGALK